MEFVSKWNAKHSLACYFALLASMLFVSIFSSFIFFGLGIDIYNLSFPITLIFQPINELIFLGITLWFARNKGATLKDLGIKNVKLKILVIVSFLAIFLVLLGALIQIAEIIVFGPDPMTDPYYEAFAPRNLFQLVILIFISLIFVGPIEELSFRGFIQKGFENSFGKFKGLIVASLLFGLAHGFNTLYAIIPITVIGLVLGYVWQKTDGNTISSALMHGVYNTIVAILMFL
jgi:membrane protease YdiL (CAAX protease family)